MRIKSFKLFEKNDGKSNKTKLLYYSFDFDDNILHMPTVIHMDHLIDGKWVPEDVGTEKFAQVRNDKTNWRIINNNPDEAFSEFRDVGKRGGDTFLDDVKTAVEDNKFAPSWDKFIECLVNGHIFSIVTSRGHEPESIRKAVEWIIDEILSDDQQYEMYQNCLKFVYLYNVEKTYDRLSKGEFTKTPLIKDYLDCCGYYGIQSSWFVSKFGNNTPEKSKGLAMKDFVSKIDKFGKAIGGKVSIGFSDDDLKFSEHIEKLFRNELSLEYIMNYHIYDTSGRGMKKTKITSESLFGLIKKEDDDIADRVIDVLKNTKDLEIVEISKYKYGTYINIDNSKIEVCSQRDANFFPVLELDGYLVYINDVKLNCSRSKSKQTFNILKNYYLSKEKNDIKVKKDELRWELRESAIGLDCAPGKEGSIIGFTSDSSMTTTLYPSEQDNRQDDYAHQFQVNFNQDLDLYTQFAYSRKKRVNEDNIINYNKDTNIPTFANFKKKKKEKKPLTEQEEEALIRKTVRELTRYVKDKSDFMVTDSMKFLSFYINNKDNQNIFNHLKAKSKDCSSPEVGDIGTVTDFYVSNTKNIYCLFNWKQKVVSFRKDVPTKYVDAKCVINYKGLA